MNSSDLTPLKDVVDIVQGSITTLAILAGGVWGYLKVIRGRLYRPRLEPTVSGRLASSGDAQYAVVKLSVKNVGLSRVQLDKSLSTLEVEAYSKKRYEPEFHRAFTYKLGVINVLRTHDWVEPGECIIDEEMVALPEEELLAVVLKFRLIQRATRFRSAKRSTEWNAVAVADAQALSSLTPTHPTPSREENDHGTARPTSGKYAGAARPAGTGVGAASGGAAAPAGAGGGTAPEER